MSCSSAEGEHTTVVDQGLSTAYGNYVSICTGLPLASPRRRRLDTVFCGAVLRVLASLAQVKYGLALVLDSYVRSLKTMGG